MTINYVTMCHGTILNQLDLIGFEHFKNIEHYNMNKVFLMNFADCANVSTN